MGLEQNIERFIKDRGINLSVMSRETGIPYMSLYDSIFNTKRTRPIKGMELIKICDFLEKNPNDFVDKEGE